ncbi:chemotaxis protein CheW [Candidatus Methylobacter oryzae]|uniref:Purine-binding chemotaxis protein CheW n=1 Tax=Candidatus Methylobacter oryzae TaxID=2497749 RepID=A0ABY3CHA4_9GAMM|nr:chemotaxis protein CheW [Candidatus Methylobacter oryzae]TRX02648.1 purine-binding chemotaxis protein CheW [Candidatus Methylobacter oryzae]
MNAITQTAQTLPANGNNREHEEQQYLTFMLSGETYAIGIARIKEIIQFTQVTEVPRMPNFIRGVINLRGAVVPVIDLSARFGKPLTPIGRRNCIIIIEVVIEEETHSVGVMVDAVNAVLEIPAGEIEPAPTFGTHIHAEFIAGMGKINGKFVIILNIQQVLSMDDMAALAAMGSAPAAELA